MNYPNRKSVRVKWDTYQNGCYFVTVCTQNKIHYFGEIQNQTIQLTTLGKQLQNIIQDTINLRQNQFIEIPIFTVMPNHFHLIITINSDTDKHQHYFGNGQSNNLSAIVRGIKSSLTSFAIKNQIPFKWQPRFHEHIIRSEKAFNFIYDYIQNNVIQWEQDYFYE
ncbi:MAG: transposase [[Pasteurella] aerogenes]|nr:transposase [[Pasteurella] aerogenes]